MSTATDGFASSMKRLRNESRARLDFFESQVAYFHQMGPTERLAVVYADWPEFIKVLRLSLPANTDLDIQWSAGTYYVKVAPK